MKNYLWIISLFLVIVFLINPSIHYASAEVSVGKKAPDFSLENLQNNKIKLSNFKGSKIFLNFWASWCPPCRAEMPYIQKLYTKKFQNTIILTVNLNEAKEKVKNFIEEKNYSFPVLLDLKGKIAGKYLIRGIPTTFVIDKKGIIIHKHVGALNYQQMLKLLAIDE